MRQIVHIGMIFLFSKRNSNAILYVVMMKQLSRWDGKLRIDARVVKMRIKPMRIQKYLMRRLCGVNFRSNRIILYYYYHLQSFQTKKINSNALTLVIN